MNRNFRLVALGLIASVIFVIIGVVFLSTSAETLDEVAEYFGASESPSWNPPLPDYEIPGLEGNTIANIIVGLLFIVLTLVITFLTGKALKAKT